jgi:hypothetical protein
MKCEFPGFHRGDVSSRGLLVSDAVSAVVGNTLHTEDGGSWYPTTTLYGVTTHKTSTSNLAKWFGLDYSDSDRVQWPAFMLEGIQSDIVNEQDVSGVCYTISCDWLYTNQYTAEKGP